MWHAKGKFTAPSMFYFLEPHNFSESLDCAVNHLSCLVSQLRKIKLLKILHYIYQVRVLLDIYPRHHSNEKIYCLQSISMEAVLKTHWCLLWSNNVGYRVLNWFLHIHEGWKFIGVFLSAPNREQHRYVERARKVSVWPLKFTEFPIIILLRSVLPP